MTPRPVVSDFLDRDNNPGTPATSTGVAEPSAAKTATGSANELLVEISLKMVLRRFVN